MKMPDFEKDQDSEMETENEKSDKCASCHKFISDKYLLKALDQVWHEDCLRCSSCQCKLMEAGSTLFVKSNSLLCKRDYLELYGRSGQCSSCQKSIPAFDMVMRLRDNVYHLECFSCSQCEKRFTAGDKVYMCDNQLLCEYDYGERQVFAHMPQLDTDAAKQIIQKQVDHMDSEFLYKNSANAKPTKPKHALQIQDGAGVNCLPQPNSLIHGV